MIAGESMLLTLRSHNNYIPYTAHRLAHNMLVGNRRWVKSTPTRTQCVIAENRVLHNQITQAFAGGEQPVRRLVTERSRAISVTADQLLSTPDGYKRASELHEHDLVNVAIWPRKYGHFLPGVTRNPSEPWSAFSRALMSEKLVAIIDTGFVDVFDFTLEFPFNNYIANEFVVSNG